MSVRPRLAAASALVVAASILAAGAPAASALPKLARVGAHVRGFYPADALTVAPDGTVFVSGLGKAARRVFVFGPSGRYERAFTTTLPGTVAGYGNGQLYLANYGNQLYGVSPLDGRLLEMVGSPDVFYKGVGSIGLTPNGNIYVGVRVSVPEKANPDTLETIDVVATFEPADAANFPAMYSTCVEPAIPANPNHYAGATSLYDVNARGQMLAAYEDAQGRTFLGVFSPQGALLSSFSIDVPRPQFEVPVWGPGGTTIYAGLDNGSFPKDSTYVAELTPSGKVLRRFGTTPINALNGDRYGAVAIAPNGDGWVIRRNGELYRFHT